MTKHRSLLYWQVATTSLLVAGYAGYYLCRSDLSVVLPLIVTELVAHGVSPDVARVRLGTIASMGVLAYAIGKFMSGGVADFLGGRRNFLAGMGGSVLCTVLFAAAGGFPFFTLSWFANRLVQSTGWTGLVKISSRWFSYESYGTVMGVMSFSFPVRRRRFTSVPGDPDWPWRRLAQCLPDRGWDSVHSISSQPCFFARDAERRRPPGTAGESSEPVQGRGRGTGAERTERSAWPACPQRAVLAGLLALLRNHPGA
jgi:hypothetical protein